MLELFVESLLLGTVLAGGFVVLRSLARRVAERRLGGLPPGEPLRCVQRVDLGGRG